MRKALTTVPQIMFIVSIILVISLHSPQQSLTFLSPSNSDKAIYLQLAPQAHGQNPPITSQSQNPPNSQLLNPNDALTQSNQTPVCQSPIPNIIQIVPGASNPNNRFAYCPQELVIRSNTFISWINNDNSVHTVTFLPLDQKKIPEFDSKLISPARTVGHLFLNSGTFHYFCTIHPFMTGTIQVQ